MPWGEGVSHAILSLLVVQYSSIGDLVSEKLSESVRSLLISVSSDHNDYNGYNDHNDYNDQGDYNDYRDSDLDLDLD